MAERYPTVPQVVDPLVETLSEVNCDTRELETIFSRHGEIIESPISVPLATFHTSIVAERIGSAKFLHSTCVAIHEETNQIFVANLLTRIVIFSDTGKFIISWM